MVGSGADRSSRFSPGRIDPTNAAFNNSRKPLAGEFTYNGQRLFVIANHFNSKGGDQPLFGRFQPPTRVTEAQRHQQAADRPRLRRPILAADPDANVVVLGDLNDFEFSDTHGHAPARRAARPDRRRCRASERYTYVFEGNSQSLDHILLSRALLDRRVAYDVVHVNAEFASQASDHDPQVARITIRPSG